MLIAETVKLIRRGSSPVSIPKRRGSSRREAQSSCRGGVDKTFCSSGSTLDHRSPPSLSSLAFTLFPQAAGSARTL